MTSTTKYAANGQYVLVKMSLFADGGGEGSMDSVEWNLKPSFIECSLFESISDQTMSGYIAVLDSLNVSDILPLYGNERIELEFYTAGAEENIITYVGKVYKVSDRVMVTQQTMGYIIRFCSEASLLSERVFTQRGFEGTSDEVVSEIYNEFLLGESEKEIFIQPAQQIQTFTFGSITPLDSIAIAIKDVVATDGTAGYVFYENNKEFRLETLQSMYQKESVAQYTSSHHGMFEDISNRAAETFERVQDLVYDEENSLMDRLQDGVHGSDHVYFDLITKQVITHHYRKEEFFDKEKSLGDKPDKKPIEDGVDTTSITYVNDTIDWTLDAVMSKMARIESETFRANATVFGDSNLRAGETLDVYFPRLNNNPEEVSNSFEGKVLISAIRHTITNDRYIQELELIRDAYNERVEE